MYSINKTALLECSRQITRNSMYIEECIEKFKNIQTKNPVDSNNEEIEFLMHSILSDIQKQKQQLDRINFVLQSVCDIVSEKDKETLNICNHEIPIKLSLSRTLLRETNYSEIIKELPIDIRINEI